MSETAPGRSGRRARRQEHGVRVRSLTVSIPGVLRQQVRALADARAVTTSAVVVEALTAYLQATERREVQQQEGVPA